MQTQQKNREITLISSSIVFQFFKVMWMQLEIQVDWENSIICHPSGLVNTNLLLLA